MISIVYSTKTPNPEYTKHLLEKVGFEVYEGFRSTAAHADWTQSVYDHHPAGKYLKAGVFCLHARNYGIVAPAQAVIALPRPPEEGGTAQGMRVGRALGLPVFNLNIPEECRTLDHWIDEL